MKQTEITCAECGNSADEQSPADLSIDVFFDPSWRFNGTKFVCLICKLMFD